MAASALRADSTLSPTLVTTKSPAVLKMEYFLRSEAAKIISPLVLCCTKIVPACYFARPLTRGAGQIAFQLSPSLLPSDLQLSVIIRYRCFALLGAFFFWGTVPPRWSYFMVAQKLLCFFSAKEFSFFFNIPLTTSTFITSYLLQMESQEGQATLKLQEKCSWGSLDYISERSLLKILCLCLSLCVWFDKYVIASRCQCSFILFEFWKQFWDGKGSFSFVLAQRQWAERENFGTLSREVDRTGD